MYNLFVSGNTDSWNGDPLIMELARCVREYTDNKLTSRFGDLTSAQVNELLRYPCVFAYESGHRKNPHFGVIRDVVMRQEHVRVEYDLIAHDRFVTAAELEELAFDLDISRWEMNRTHWAVKDVNLAKELHAKGIALPHWARGTGSTVDITAHRFDVALPFPGEIRGYIEEVAGELERLMGPHSYFYDNNYVSQLARTNLDVLLQDIYRDRSQLVVAFIGGDYQRKEWCGIELRAVRELIMARDEQKVMFIRVDDGGVDGVTKTDGFVDARQHTPQDVAHFIQQRVDLLANSPRE